MFRDNNEDDCHRRFTRTFLDHFLFEIFFGNKIKGLLERFLDERFTQFGDCNLLLLLSGTKEESITLRLFYANFRQFIYSMWTLLHRYSGMRDFFVSFRDGQLACHPSLKHGGWAKYIISIWISRSVVGKRIILRGKSSLEKCFFRVISNYRKRWSHLFL